MMSPLNGPDDFAKAEAAFKDIRAYILSLEPPKYPLPIDRELAVKGETLFVQTCARCHGTYGAKWTYPNRVVPIDEIGTDRTRFDGISRKFGEHYNNSWFAKEEAGWLGEGYKVKRVEWLSGAAARRHLGDGPVSAQRLGADVCTTC